MAILLILSAMLIAGCTSPSAEQTVKTGDTASVDYTGWFDNGTIFDTTDASTAQQAGIYSADIPYEPINVTVGSGEFLQAFEDALVGMKAGESKNVTLTPDQAYGEYDPAQIQPVNMSILLENNITPHVNDTLYYDMQPVTVYSIPNNTTMMIDFNHPMAGKNLNFRITVRKITPANASASAT